MEISSDCMTLLLLFSVVQGIGDKYWVITNSQAVIHRKSLSIVDLTANGWLPSAVEDNVMGEGL